MKALKIIGIILLVIVVLFLGVAVFLPKDVSVKATITMDAPANTIFKQVNTMENWDKWSPFMDEAQGMEITYEGNKTGLGAIQSWKTENEKGSLEIIESIPYKSITTDIDLMPGDDVSGQWTFDEADGQTTVSWGVNFRDLSYPIGRYMGLASKTMMMPYLEKGLENIKKVAEELPAYPEISKTKLEKQISISIQDTFYFAEMSQKMGEVYGQLAKFAKTKRLKMAGPPYCSYQVWKPEEGYTIARCGIPILKEVKGKDHIEFFEMEPTEALMLVYKGPYDQMESQYLAMDEYMAEFRLEGNGGPLEVYVTDPGTEADPNKWVTNIYFPIK
jgi:effector-binding domain-containing protein